MSAMLMSSEEGSMANSAEQIIEAKRPGQDSNVLLKLTDLKLFSHGVYSNVYTGVIHEGTPNRTVVAVKKCWSTDESELKEVRILQRLGKYKPKNIANLMYVFSKTYEDKICSSLIMQFMPSSLSSHIKARKQRPLDIIETKIFTWQMFRGLALMHKIGITHRDLKPQNILINPDTLLLQIADFGSSIIAGEYDAMSSYQVTRFYRPPELLLGAHKYGAAIDVWSAGCVFAEMLRGKILLPGHNTEHQLEKILDCFGPPTKPQLKVMHARRPKLLERPGAVRAIELYNARKKNNLTVLMPFTPDEAIRLIERILKYSPRERLCGPKLLSNSFFGELFDPRLTYNGKRLNLLTRNDLNQAVAGDVPPGSRLSPMQPSLSYGSLESKTGGTNTSAISNERLSTERLSTERLSTEKLK